MGELVTYLLGTRQEPSSDILKRISNDPDILGIQQPLSLKASSSTPRHQTTWAPAFQGIQNQIIRLTK